MKLHLGCGRKKLEGFINIDIRETSAVDVVSNVATLDGVEPSSTSVIYASHVLEHFGRSEYRRVLKRWFEVLEPGGLLRVSVPDFDAVVRRYSETRNLEEVLGLLYGRQNYPENYHNCIWDYTKMHLDLNAAGFVNVRVYDWRETEHADIDDYSQAYLPHMDKEEGMLMSLNVEATKP